MSWKKGSSFFKTTTFRLTFLYLVVFSALSVAVYLMVYMSLAIQLQVKTDEDLLDEAKEFDLYYRDHGLESLHGELATEVGGPVSNYKFYQFLSSAGTPLAMYDARMWKEIARYRPGRADVPKDQPSYESFPLPGREYKARLISLPIDGGERIEICYFLRHEEMILGSFRETFGIALVIMMSCGGLLGFLLARKAMAGVQRVTDTATGIGRNDLGRRVPLAGEGEEINALARAFNAMLERIEGLLNEVRQITDNVAHELRTPITQIRGTAETTLQGGGDLDEYREMAASVIEGCDDLIEMIGTMLEIAQVDCGTVEFELVPVDLVEIVAEASDLFAPMAERGGVHIRVVRSSRPVLVEGNRRKIQRVVANLLDNAVKYTPCDGVVTATVGIDGGNAIIEISDTGTGIKENDIPHIFERFYRGDKSRSTTGSGLGLSLALAVVRAHSGDITVKSSKHGSTFAFSLPTVPSPQIQA